MAAAPEANRFCGQCGTQVNPGAMFCTGCGTASA
ncbi:zinc-ribbon domain-containing protein [Paractinoplanes durhamensis]